MEEVGQLLAVRAAANPLQGFCPTPFLDMAKFPLDGGNTNLRLCAPLPIAGSNLTCCLPCPFTDWIYPQSFKSWYRAAEILSAAGLVICVFLLITWFFLPPEKSRRHYLSICLVIAVMIESLAFVIPLATQPPQCYNEITPNDMFTNLPCAFSGAFVVAGALSTTVWIFIRAFSMHLQVCWDITPGNKFFYASQALGWGTVGTFFILTMTYTGVSFRFGEACHVNSGQSVRDFWGPMLAITAASTLVQFMTFAYCIKVYLANIWSDDTKSYVSSSSGAQSGLPSYNSSIRAQSAKAVYQRMKKVLWLQWRSISIVLFLILDVLFFAIIWIQLDKKIEDALHGRLEQFQPFLTCLFTSKGEKTKCFALGQQTLVNQPTVIAILMLLSLTGVQTGLMMSRTSMYTGWWELITKKTNRRNPGFVSLDAKSLEAGVNTKKPAVELKGVDTSRAPRLTLTRPIPIASPPRSRLTSPNDEEKGSDFWVDTKTVASRTSLDSLSPEPFSAGAGDRSRWLGKT